jgi:activator of 2-hydroxyglutaryl-CoA dehydratase
MDPMTIALICAASFGAVVALSAFIRQLILSRDKNLNDAVQSRALNQEAGILEKMRAEIRSNSPIESFYKTFEQYQKKIHSLDEKIDTINDKKTGSSYKKMLVNLQQRRADYWDASIELQKALLAQQQSQNKSLDEIYKEHSLILKTIYIRHTDHTEHIAKQSIDAGSSTFKTIIMAPLHFLLQYFNLSTGIAIQQARIETIAREDVEQMEDEINNPTENDEINAAAEADAQRENSPNDEDVIDPDLEQTPRAMIA